MHFRVCAVVALMITPELGAAQNSDAGVRAEMAGDIPEACYSDELFGRVADETAVVLISALAAARAAEAEARVAASHYESSLAVAIQASAADQRRLALLNKKVATLRREIDQLQFIVDAAVVRDADAQVQIEKAETQVLAERAAVEALRRRLADIEANLSQDEAEQFARIAAAEALHERVEEMQILLVAARLGEDEARTEAERYAALLATANETLAEHEARAEADLRRLTLLNAQVGALRREIAQLSALVDDAVARDVATQVQIEALGSRLNVALARAAAEERRARALEEAERLRLEDEARRLERYASEFFGRLREVLADREGVQIVGDRFVFSSEVLFPPARAELSPEGQAQIARVVALLREVSDEIPEGIDWILRVDGHTDDRPLGGGGQFADNWELSQGRALSVVRFMIDSLGFPPDRLAAAGFGENRPVADNATESGRAQNRRIELKLTER